MTHWLSDDVVHVCTDGGHIGHPATQVCVAVQLAVPPHDVLQEPTQDRFPGQTNSAPLHAAQLEMHALTEAQ
jgi:hypothetical protein